MTTSTLEIQEFNKERDIEERIKEVMERIDAQIALAELDAHSRKRSKKDKTYYLVPALKQFLDKIVKLDNLVVDTTEVVKVQRLVKVNRYIKPWELQYHGAETVMLEGLYMVVEGYLLPTKKVEEAWDLKKNRVPSPAEYGLPSTSEVQYGTMKEISEGTCFVLCQNWATKYINRPSHWKYVYM
ncbi:hypothetical protein LIS04_102 [Listeria phage LIS04]|nr:hypothetical protein LIS04_102 [Listeria phage LIS04]